MAIFIDRQLGPEERLKSLLGYSGNVEIDPNVSAKFYYKSGLNMYRQFNIYYNEGSWENAYCIYLKFDKLFFDRIKQHPDYSHIPVRVKGINATNFRIIRPKAKHAEREIFKQYQRDYLSFVEEMKAKKRQEIKSEDSSRAVVSVRSTKRSTIKVITTDTVVTPRESLNAEEEEEEQSLDPALLMENPNFEIKSEVSFNTARRITEFESRQKKILDEDEQKTETKKASDSKITYMEKSTSSISDNVTDIMTSVESQRPSAVRKSTLKSTRTSRLTSAARSSRPVSIKIGSGTKSMNSSRQFGLKSNTRASRKSQSSSYTRRSIRKSIPRPSEESLDD